MINYSYYFLYEISNNLLVCSKPPESAQQNTSGTWSYLSVSVEPFQTLQTSHHTSHDCIKDLVICGMTQAGQRNLHWFYH